MKVRKDCQVIISPLLQSSISTVWNRRCNRGQYCIGSSTRVIISPSLPSTGTILNNGTWHLPPFSVPPRYNTRTENLILSWRPLPNDTKAYTIITYTKQEKDIRYLQEDDIKEDMDLAVSLEDSLKQPCLWWKRWVGMYKCHFYPKCHSMCSVAWSADVWSFL
jgi:hypothetical protein